MHEQTVLRERIKLQAERGAETPRFGSWTVLGAELVLSGLILRSMVIRRLFCGKPVILIDNGHILQENLRRTRITLDELMGHLREKDVLHVETVQYAILETDGNLSVSPIRKKAPSICR